jgi:hypothetical protein
MFICLYFCVIFINSFDFTVQRGGGLFPGVKQPEREAYNCPPYCAEDNNE